MFVGEWTTSLLHFDFPLQRLQIAARLVCKLLFLGPRGPLVGEISSDLYRLSGCDILNLTFCRLDFHQLLIEIS